jgi:hypothetical protein
VSALAHDPGLLAGAVDLHVHPGPSPYPRRIDPVEAATSATEAGMAAIVLKSHHHCTAFAVETLERYGLDEAGVSVFGGIVLNSYVGGLNPNAVNLSLELGGRVVWLPTTSSPAHISHTRETSGHFPTSSISLIPDRPVEVLDGLGKVRPELLDILRLVADADAVLASGHLDAQCVITVFTAAREAGVTRLVVNHPNFIVDASTRDAERLIELGAYIEHAASHYHPRSGFRMFEIDVLLGWLEAVGVDHSILASDLGQANNPLPTEGLEDVAVELMDRGVSEMDVRRLLADNPAKLLGVQG